jgi:hypothetical protein
MSRTIRQKRTNPFNALRKQYRMASKKVRPNCPYGKLCCGDDYGPLRHKNNKIKGRRTMKRTLEQSPEVADDLVSDLANDQAEFITGPRLSSGGYYLRIAL